MEHSISPKIADNYDPKADNIDTLREWHDNNKKVTWYLLSYQALFPILVMMSSPPLAILYFLYAKSERKINSLVNSDLK